MSSASRFGGAVSLVDGRLQLHDPAALASPHMDALVHQAVFGTEAER